MKDCSDLEFDEITISGNSVQKVVPSLENPSEVESCGDDGNINVVKSNKNSLDTQKNANSEGRGIIVETDENGIVTINGTTTSAAYIKLYNNLIVASANEIENEKREFKKGIYNFSFKYLSGTKSSNNTNLYFRSSAFSSTDISYSIANHNIVDRNISFELKEDGEFVIYDWIEAGATFNNYKFAVQIERVETLQDESTDYIPHESQTHTIYTQQPFFENDIFVKKEGKWYEKHYFGYVSTLNHDPIVVAKNAGSTDDFSRYVVSLGVTNRKKGTAPSETKILCTHFANTNARWTQVEGVCGWENGSSFCIGTFDTNLDTSEKLKEYLLNNDVKIYYELAEPILLECTEKQSEQLDALEASKNYKNGTIVYSTDEVSPLFDITYRKDLDTVLANDKVELQEQIDAIKALLSTTNTSAMLLDNMQTDLESEVE